MFDLKHPCRTCPFRRDTGGKFGLSPQRLDGIFDAPAFQCHKTVDYDAPPHDDDDDDGDDGGLRASEGLQGTRPQQCAGLMALLQRERRPSRIMHFAERILPGILDRLDPRGEAFDSFEEARVAHGAHDCRRRIP